MNYEPQATTSLYGGRVHFLRCTSRTVHLRYSKIMSGRARYTRGHNRCPSRGAS